jgi:uncharacterized coiled-coil protein SlyX
MRPPRRRPDRPPPPNTAAIDAQTIARLSQLIDTQTEHINQLKTELAHLQHRLTLQTAVIAGLDEALAQLTSATWQDEVNMTTGEITRIYKEP